KNGSLLPLALLLGVSSACACATSEDDLGYDRYEDGDSSTGKPDTDPDDPDADDDDDGGSGGSGKGGSGGSGGKNQTDGSGGDDDGGDGGPDEDGDTGGSGGSGAGGTGGSGGNGGTGGSGGSGGSTVVPCTSPNICANARNIGSIAGDKGSPYVQASGCSSEWLQLRVTEDDTSLTNATPMRIKVTLTPANTTNFDLYVYVNKDSDKQECIKVSGSSMNTMSVPDIVSLSWGESGVVPNGKDDSRWVSIEVRHYSGECDLTKPWKILVEGNKK
ncbi:MAG: hypothetical protein FWD57_13750, partial [Polyangiaceae bacterium]|nr:hypothetical protein [Polyangiaceae bacterium]